MSLDIHRRWAFVHEMYASKRLIEGDFMDNLGRRSSTARIGENRDWISTERNNVYRFKERERKRDN
jgi:hypothetical protein